MSKAFEVIVFEYDVETGGSMSFVGSASKIMLGDTIDVGADSDMLMPVMVASNSQDTIVLGYSEGSYKQGKYPPDTSLLPNAQANRTAYGSDGGVYTIAEDTSITAYSYDGTNWGSYYGDTIQDVTTLPEIEPLLTATGTNQFTLTGVIFL